MSRDPHRQTGNLSQLRMQLEASHASSCESEAAKRCGYKQPICRRVITVAAIIVVTQVWISHLPNCMLSWHKTCVPHPNASLMSRINHVLVIQSAPPFPFPPSSCRVEGSYGCQEAVHLSEAGETADVEAERVATHAVAVDSHTTSMLAAHVLMEIDVSARLS